MATKNKQKQSTEKLEFLKQLEKENNFDIDNYLREVLCREPYVNNAKRRWRFIISFTKFVYKQKEVDFITVVRWFARNGEVMNCRTIKENYIEYLELLGIIEWNENTKIVKWKGEGLNLD